MKIRGLTDKMIEDPSCEEVPKRDESWIEETDWAIRSRWQEE